MQDATCLASEIRYGVCSCHVRFTDGLQTTGSLVDMRDFQLKICLFIEGLDEFENNDDQNDHQYSSSFSKTSRRHH